MRKEQQIQQMINDLTEEQKGNLSNGRYSFKELEEMIDRRNKIIDVLNEKLRDLSSLDFWENG